MKTTIKTGKEEHIRRSILRIEENLKAYPSYISGYYYFMRNSGKTASYKTHEVYLNHVIKFFREIEKEPEEVTMDDITMYMAKISIKEDGSSVSGSYLVAVYSALKKFFKYMMSSKKITENPMEYVERPAPKKSELVERTYLTKREIKKLFKAIDEENGRWALRDKSIFILFFSTGIRCTALTEINIDNVDFENNCVYVLDKGTKFNTFYLSGDKMRVLAEWIKQRDEIMEQSNNDTKALFISDRRKRVDQSTIYLMVKHYSGLIGHEISPHKARASFATNALNSGLNLYEVSKLMNHSTPSVTAACYIQGQDEVTKENSLKAASYLNF